ncbi:MAG: hypothetical protein WBA39_10560 [Rivularia sp. (in: cyanobacteria)]
MNTPSHAILNLVAFSEKLRNKASLAIFIGAVIPDVPIFIFYFLMKFVYRYPSSKIWGEIYFQPFWQNIVSIFHSIPLALIGVLICHFAKWKVVEIGFISMVMHSLLDLPVHNDDAHRHFYPFSDYRFISPFSYWDANHYGAIVAFIEMSLVLASTVYLFSGFRSYWVRGLMISVNVVYLFGYFRFYSNQ